MTTTLTAPHIDSTKEGATMTTLSPARIMEVGMAFWPAKTLLSAIELGLFTTLGAGAMTGAELQAALGLHARANPDFFDTLVALRFLDRDGDGADGALPQHAGDRRVSRSRTARATWAAFSRWRTRGSIRFWGDLTDGAAHRAAAERDQAHRRGRCSPSSTASRSGSSSSWTRWPASPPAISRRSRRSSTSRATRRCATSAAPPVSSRSLVARRAPAHAAARRCDLPPATADRRAEDRRRRASPTASRRRRSTSSPIRCRRPTSITMGMILHDWNLEKKMQLVQGGLRCAAARRRVHRRRKPDRRRAARERLRADDVAEHADRVRRRVRLHRRRLRRVVPRGRLP